MYLFIGRFFWIAYSGALILLGMLYFDVPRLLLLLFLLVLIGAFALSLIIQLLTLEAKPSEFDVTDEGKSEEKTLSFRPLRTITPIASGFHPSRLYMLATVIGSSRKRGAKDQPISKHTGLPGSKAHH
ncbi:hypothetical protein SAMN04515647_3491 [Cohaesibacter sp. ES.047]|uniref:hypothetical protein n=1 Tax=Cohaesibacter sp. ES.047 TaxID=1798205 RepID=UPI000BB7818D|nr:hypothetical protein [Cohaesibacter sp. ES.047]SNY93204.1 hypothetical protein SAMN04515647_3491 [Cohaesibacter sp. ES.047]